MYKCKICGVEYNTYPIIINDDMETLLIEANIREEFYDDSKKIGLCSNCRKLHIYDDKTYMAKMLMPIRLKLELDEAEVKGDDNGIKESITRLEEMRKHLMENTNV